MLGPQYVFNIVDVSLLDINELIDIGKRFTLRGDLPDSEYDNLEEYLREGRDNRAAISSQGRG